MKNESNLQVTLCKRDIGVFKKANKLVNLCGDKVVLIVYSPRGKIFSYGHSSKLKLLLLRQKLHRSVEVKSPQSCKKNSLAKAVTETTKAESLPTTAESDPTVDAEETRTGDGAELWCVTEAASRRQRS
ncbi:hypothetical protein M9H77_14078 [Catharanthus roseus]|uniref:Uncharacterized protein n=1 Tax=Catharanthus roseus TaxID=4058 RepID=A0ACC0BM09_CATRO|nr:hypothetical protein M9H77_14078 [Catharanthus roseus]